MYEKANRTRGMALDAELKVAKKDTVALLFKEGIFEEMEGAGAPAGQTAIKCVTCQIKLQGMSGKRLNAQLFMHFIDNKHTMRLRVAVKAEEIGPVSEDEEIPDEPDKEPEEKDLDEEPGMLLPDPITLSVHQFLTAEEAELLLEAMATPPDDPEVGIFGFKSIFQSIFCPFW